MAEKWFHLQGFQTGLKFRQHMKELEKFLASVSDIRFTPPTYHWSRLVFYRDNKDLLYRINIGVRAKSKKAAEERMTKLIAQCPLSNIVPYDLRTSPIKDMTFHVFEGSEESRDSETYIVKVSKLDPDDFGCQLFAEVLDRARKTGAGSLSWAVSGVEKIREAVVKPPCMIHESVELYCGSECD
jgi:hypothetical protein